ncbi:hypothetical protein [Klebsiella electrica]|nr:hypothetical protein [Klebsiella electrica]
MLLVDWAEGYGEGAAIIDIGFHRVVHQSAKMMPMPLYALCG